MRRSLTASLAAAALFVAAGVAWFALDSGTTPTDPLANSSADVAAVTRLLESCAGPGVAAYQWENCAIEKMPASMEAFGPAAVITAVYEYAKPREKEADFGCHQLMHRVGRDTVAYIPDMTTGMQMGQLLCQLGFQHGIIEQNIDNADSMKAVTTVCDTLIADTSLPALIVGECYHAIGHGVIKRVGYDYRAGLRACELEITKPDMQLGCVGGVIMTWSNALDGLVLSGKPVDAALQLAPPDRQWEACLLLTEQGAREGCANFTSEKVPPTPEAYRSFGAWCKTTLGVVDNCLYGVGRVQGGRAPLSLPEPGKVAEVGFRDVPGIVERCNAVAEGLGTKPDGCLTAAVSSRANFDPDTSFIDKICAAAPATPCETFRSAWDNSTKPRNG